MVLLQENIDFITTLFDKSLTLGVLGIFAWVMWKRDDRYRKHQEEKLKTLEQRIEKQENEDREKILNQLKRTTEVQHETNIVLKATNRIVECFIGEMSEFKDSEVYKYFLTSKFNKRNEKN